VAIDAIVEILDSILEAPAANEMAFMLSKFISGPIVAWRQA